MRLDEMAASYKLPISKNRGEVLSDDGTVAWDLPILTSPGHKGQTGAPRSGPRNRISITKTVSIQGSAGTDACSTNGSNPASSLGHREGSIHTNVRRGSYQSLGGRPPGECAQYSEAKMLSVIDKMTIATPT